MTNPMRHFLNWLFCLSVAATTSAAEIVGVVTKVSDGDTIWVTAKTGREKIRLDRIDAPETDQPYGRESTAILSNMVRGQQVRVDYSKRDQYGRVLGIVFLGTNDVNLAMVREGAAWHYKYFDKTPAYSESEADAKSNRRGLWAKDTPINPYEWRRRRRAGR